jgi:tyrosyl-tRNA synthetase
LLFTDFLPVHVDTFREMVAKDPAAINVAKEVLALEATKILHGELAAQIAIETSRAAFAGEGDSTDGLPSMPFTAGMTVFDAVLGLGLATSKNEVRRLCAGCALRAASRLTARCY